MRIYKGLHIPKAKKNSKNKGHSLKKTFCYRTAIDDCNRVECDECLFFDVTKEEFPEYNVEAFFEWFKAKGKVQYD